MNIYSKFLTVAAFAFSASFNVAAQTITCIPQGHSLEEPSLDKSKASIVFRSTYDGWIINQKQNHDGDMACRSSNDGKEYIYEFLVDVSKSSERTYIISRSGNLTTSECVVKGLRKGYRVVYNISEQAEDNLQRIEANQFGEGNFYGGNSACVEITTEIKNLELTTGWKVTPKTASNGARILEVVVDIPDLEMKKNRRDSLKTLFTEKTKECERLRQAYYAKVERIENADKEEEIFNNAEKAVTLLEPDVRKADSIYNSYKMLTIGGAGIKPLSIELVGLAPKKRYRYAVVALTESFEDLLSYARSLRDGHNSHIDFGYYEAMRIAYKKVVEHKDAPQSQLESLENESQEMLAIRQLIWYMELAQKKVDEAEHKQGAESEAVYKNLLARCNIAKKIMADYPEIEGVREVYNSTHTRLLAHPLSKNRTTETVSVQRQVISGKVVKGPSFLLDVSGLRVYAVSFSGKVKNSNYKKEIGRIRQDGSFRIVLSEPTNYIYIEGEKESRPISSDTSEMGTLVLER